MKQGKMDKKVVKYFLLAAVLVLAVTRFNVLLSFAGKLWKIAFPLVLGAVMAYILNIIMSRLEKIYFPNSKNKFVTKSRRFVCIFFSLFLIALIVFMIFRLVIPELVETITLIGRWIPIGLVRVQTFLAENSDQIPALEEWISGLQLDWKGVDQKVIQYLTHGVGDIVGSTISLVGTIGGGITNFVIALIFSIYILANKEKLRGQTVRMAAAYCKPAFIKKAGGILTVADETFSSFIVGQCTEAVILGALCIVGMQIFQFPYAPMVGTFIGATALIPVVGAYLGGAVGFIMILTVSPLKAVLFIVFLVVLQQLEGNIIYPRVVGSSVGLPGMWVLAAVTIGGGISGVGGMLLGVPLAATIYKLIKEDVCRKVPRESGETAENPTVASELEEKKEKRNKKEKDKEDE